MSRIYARVLRQFGRMPAPVRHKLVGLTSPSYRIGTVAVIITDTGSVLLVKHTYRNGWGLPGGMMGWREEPLAAIEREVQEEVGLRVEPVRTSSTWQNPAGSNGTSIFASGTVVWKQTPRSTRPRSRKFDGSRLATCPASRRRHQRPHGRWPRSRVAASPTG